MLKLGSIPFFHSSNVGLPELTTNTKIEVVNYESAKKVEALLQTPLDRWDATFYGEFQEIKNSHKRAVLDIFPEEIRKGYNNPLGAHYYDFIYRTGLSAALPLNNVMKQIALVQFLPDYIKKMGCFPNRIHDLGCGDGGIAISFAKQLPNATIIGTDISAGAIERCHLNYQQAIKDGELEQNRIKFIQDDYLSKSSKIKKFELALIISPAQGLRSLMPKVVPKLTKNGVLITALEIDIFFKDYPVVATMPLREKISTVMNSWEDVFSHPKIKPKLIATLIHDPEHILFVTKWEKLRL